MVTCPKCGAKAGEVSNCYGFCPMIQLRIKDLQRIEALLPPAPVKYENDFDFDFFDEVLA